MKGRGLQILLVCSLVLNVFVIGGLAGAAIMWHRAAAEHPVMGIGAGRAGRLRQAAMALSPQYRRELRRTIRETLQGLEAEIGSARGARLEAARLLDEPKLDQAALQAALDKARAADMTIRTRIETAVVQFAAALPPEERAALARGLAPPGAAGGTRP
ncbi:MAG: periplasmic heavy metal sensor [Sphingomonadales bacterium]|nr:periplasmic heavy metal sensor [Sphingomonadales bacterium]